MGEVLIFAWVYEITPEGLKPTVEVPHGQSWAQSPADSAVISPRNTGTAWLCIVLPPWSAGSGRVW